jgi:uncharacterized membrane protein (UPF0127 family)
MTTEKKRSVRFWIVLIILLPIVLGGIYVLIPKSTRDVPTGPTFTKEGELTIHSADSQRVLARLDIEIANSELDIREGLMYRTELEANQGMLFVLDREEPQSFWMLNTYLALDIVFTDGTGRIVRIARNNQPHALEPIPSIEPAQYALEVNAGFCTEHGVDVGDWISWEGARSSGSSEN